MKSCGDIKDALSRGEPLTDPEFRAHLEVCSACALLAESTGALPRFLRAAEAPSNVDLDRLFVRVRDRLKDEAHAAGWLRSRPTWVRRVIALATSLLLVLFGVYALRPDAGVYPADRMALALIAWSIPLLFTTWIALRPAYRPALSAQSLVAVSGASLVLLFVVSALPAPNDAHPAAVASFEPGLIPHAVPCFVFGTLIALPVFAISRLLDHRVSRTIAVAGASAAGLTANMTLQLHCPATNPLHLLCGHFSVALLLVAVVSLAAVIPWERWARK